MSSSTFSIFTSESVSEGHPDKLADQISDAVLDACLTDDPASRVACETFTTTGMVLIGGEITTRTYVDVQAIARDVARDVGYTHADYGLDCESMSVLNVIHNQSPDIAMGVTKNELYEGQQGAGDQGIMFGFACNETVDLMPAPVSYAHQILRCAAELRKTGVIPWLRPDSKCQVSVRYEGDRPVGIDSVVVSHQHDPDIANDDIRATVIEKIIKPVFASTELLGKDTRYYINPTGRFVVGGPHGDAGLTGRKTIVDTYGGMARHGGGAFSGKDPSKVDRSATYMARYVARNIVASGIADRVELQIAYAIGVPFPVSVMVDSFGTGKVEDMKMARAVQEIFDLTPAGIEKTLNLRRPIYRKTTNYGHFGKEGFSWEKTDKVDALKSALKNA